MLSKDEKNKIIDKFKLHEKDRGSVAVQIALLTNRINALNEHFKIHRKDFSGKRQFMKLIGKRRRLLRYLRRSEPKLYSSTVEKLGLEK